MKYDFGVEDQVILREKLFTPFKPDAYDSQNGRVLFNLDITRCCTNFVLNFIIIGLRSFDAYHGSKDKKTGVKFIRFLVSILDEILLFVLFMTQLILIT